ncbi:uncharacterized protein P174DRAFT_440956 [Aspergillus novofumigatus IBT 16806]|uniref:Uncharacterized protein n=1 Tax=Aspergillus novofumigatus (strain IBT 16806) TaxID=1392255 RepID=A0A2I1C7T2_ASPN1|nr:uncharacterized protein P174DRAFT_440956 [Aspergillus novofumigatus IBT 16806]PKX93697.1 hypothetical protein P174DRAFT_440956 [Aspergillus novofumigatus IBT 16806]
MPSTPSQNNKTGTLPPPPPPPPPPPLSAGVAPAPAPAPQPEPPAVAEQGPPGAFLVELLIYNGYPFKDHWAYWVRSHTDKDLGVKIHATGDRIPLQWVNGQYFDEKAMFNNGEHKIDNVPVCQLEASAHKIKAPGKSLNTTSGTASSAGNVGKKVTQRNCQTWIVESAEQLVKDNIFRRETADYLCAIEQ